MWEVFTQAAIPFGDIENDEEVGLRKVRGELLTRPDTCPDHHWLLMLQCWNQKPEDRPTFETLHEQLKNIQGGRSPFSSRYLSN